MYSCLVGVDDVVESRLQRSATNQEAINVGLLRELTAVLLGHTASIQDACLLSSLGGDLLLQPFTNSSVNLLCLLGGSDLAGTDSPGR